ncbi:U6 snRNA phosphodiesterase [Anoplophora glabripennis]|uniref:U6 snRNA phosphodiesterase n=1 Tax=Anoplophora glabripennis TaxID=217634 RepID=UPI0008746D6C|nr:U6 snRNA phosphodiesterase [Anoplophora glabripennis]
MHSKGALNLLIDYGGDSSDEDNPGPGISVKRLHETEGEEFENSKKVKRLPVPNIFLSDDKTTESFDDPLLHSGKLRTFPHERGNWATYVYIPYEENEGINELIDVIRKCTHDVDIKKTDNFHISLTKTIVLKHHWISLFANSIRTKMACIKKFMILFDSLKVYCNEERTRTFIGLQIKTGYDSLLKLVESLDKCLSEFNLPPFYENPSFHMSIAWCVGDFEEELKSLLPQLNRQLHELMDDFSQENWYIYVQYLLCKTGNKYFQFYLT